VQNTTPALGTHEFIDDARNASILIYINSQLLPRAQALVSVFDSGFVLGDGVWEGLRVVAGHPVFLDAHLDRLFEGAKAIALDIGMDRGALTQAIYRTLSANAMHDGVHIRLMVTRGIKRTPYQDPRVCIGPATVVMIPEYKTPLPETLQRGLKLFTVHVRRGHPDVQDPKLNSHSKLNCITACIQAANAGADEALMLDPHGFVATCNSTHFFIVRRGEVWTSTGDYCLGGITRANVIELCRQNNIVLRERNFSLTEVYSAEEAFVTGTFAGLVPVTMVDGRTLDSANVASRPMIDRLQKLYLALVQADVEKRSALQAANKELT
jgi:branched-chain amino acid aminotransferase